MGNQKSKSQLDNEIASCHFEEKTTSQVVTKLHRIGWTIENIAHLPENTEIKGPEFHFTRNCVCYIAFQKTKKGLLISLHNETNENMPIIEGKLVILNSGGKKLFETDFPSMTFKNPRFFKFLISKKKLKINSLKDDKLVIDCCLKVLESVMSRSDIKKSKEESQKKLIQDLKAMCDNPDYSDFTLQIDDKTIHVSKNILSARSEYFKNIFETQKDQQDQNSFVIEAQYTTMKMLIEFLYTGNLSMTEDNVQEIFSLYSAADEYKVVDLKAWCAAELMSSATKDNILEVLQFAASHHDEKLKFEAMKFMSFCFEEILISEKWKAFASSEEHLASEVLDFCCNT